MRTIDTSALSAFAYHGGALDVAARAFPDAPKPWIDLSTGINPEAYPFPPLDAAAFARLPEEGALGALEAAAARRYGSPSGSVVAAPGVHALIGALATLQPSANVGVLGPTYAGHERGWAAFGARVSSVARLEGLAGFERAVVVNPNNPDGRVVSRADLLDLASGLWPGALLIVDEAFADFDDGQTLAGEAGRPTLVVLRSFGKAYGLAGLRLSFALAAPDVAAALRRALGPWPVSGPAIAIGATALADEAWFAAAKARAKARAERLDAILGDAGWSILGGASLFRLARHPQASEKFVQLAQAGILTRRFAQAPDQLRFGLPLGEAEAASLEKAMAPQK